MNTLAPLLSSEHQPGLLEVEIPGDPAGLVLDQGALTRRNLAIIDRDTETGRPRTAVAADAAPLRGLARQLGKENQATFSTVRASEGTTFFSSGPVIFADIEIAALKSALLTFDHMLRNTPWQFTRRAELENVREFVRQAVMGRSLDAEACHRFSLGQQYDRVALYQQLRRQIPWPSSPFEHSLFAASIAPYRCIDIVWLVLGFDPFGFRVCYEWDGGDFAFGIVNGVLRGGGHSDAVLLSPPAELLCSPTMRRAFPEPPSSSAEQEDLMTEAMESVSNHRRQAFQEAVYYAEMHADDSVREKFVEAASCDPPGDRVAGIQITRKLQRLYGRTSQADAFSRILDESFNQRTQDLPSTTRSQRITTEENSPEVDWTVWLQVYRDCLTDLRQIFGLPGDAFQSRVVLRADQEGSRLVGENPAIE